MTAPTPRRPIVGPLLVAVGALHTALTPVLFRSSVRSALDGGVVASIEADSVSPNQG